MIHVFGGVNKIYDAYFSTLHKSIESDLGKYNPHRIGHITLVEKFKRKYPNQQPIHHYTNPILDAIAAKGYELDYNGAGFVKPLCLDSYPPQSVAIEATKRKIPLIYGSDAHSIKGLAQGYHQLFQDHLD
jgi:histidinol-phosphatase (PHP family)